MSFKDLIWLPVIGVCAVCIAFTAGCDDDDDDDDGATTDVVVEEEGGAEADTGGEAEGDRILASGTRDVMGGASLATAVAPIDGNVTASASWDTPGLAGTVILKVGPNEADRGSGVGSANATGYADDGQQVEVLVEFGGVMGGTVSYSVVQTPR